jgi:hypothetical protein
LQAKPILEILPYPHSEAAMNKKMIMIFLGLLAKLAKPAIILTLPI